MAYHNADHTLDVMQAAETLADNEGISNHDKRLLLAAALFHDSGFLVAREEHEVQSCIFAARYLPDYGYQPAEIETICGIIMATRLPQTPETHLQAIICDADLDYLGRDDFFELSDRLFTELKTAGLIKDENDWNIEQADFMGNHNYHTQTGKKLRQPKQEQYVELIKSKISNPIF